MATLYTQPIRSADHLVQQLPSDLARGLQSRGLALGKNYLVLSPEAQARFDGEIDRAAIEIGSYKGRNETQISVQYLSGDRVVNEVCYLFKKQQYLIHVYFDEAGRDFLPMPIETTDDEARAYLDGCTPKMSDKVLKMVDIVVPADKNVVAFPASRKSRAAFRAFKAAI